METTRGRILVIEDSPVEQVAIRQVLVRAGYDVEVCATGNDGLDLARTWAPDAVVLDLGLPDVDGLDACAQMRRFTDAYVVMLTGRDDRASRHDGLRIGADAYLTKPWDAEDLLLTLDVVFRRPRISAPPATGGKSRPAILGHGDVEIDADAHEVRVAGDRVHVTAIESRILELLVEAAGRPVARSALVAEVWGPSWSGGDHGISVHIANLRKKIDPNGAGRVATVRGVGYRLVDLTSERAA